MSPDCPYINNLNSLIFLKPQYDAFNLTKKLFCITLSPIVIKLKLGKEIFVESKKHRY